LTERLLEIPHNCFVFVSSHAVYPADGIARAENDELHVSSALSLYGTCKLLGEQLVLSRSAWPVVLRCSSLVGETGRPNNIMRILRRQSGSVYLSGDSPYNLIAYEQVLELIQLIWAEKLKGVFNLGASDWKTLRQIADHLGVNIEFGNHLYVPPIADLRKVQEISPVFRKSTLEIARWVSDRMFLKGGD
jgi:nucleoside-diphosphate-sugar epimerase